MNLNDLFDYKNQLMKDLLSDREIVHLLAPELDFSDAKSLAYKQVFPYEYLPDTVNEGNTYICFEISVSSVFDKTFLEPEIGIWMFTHKSMLRLTEGGIRIDKLASRICEVINGSANYGLGRLRLESVYRFAPMEDYNGKAMVFTAKEFNMNNSNPKQFPSNRKF